MEEYQNAEYEYSILNTAVKALEQKKSALENLVKLHLGGYFSEPAQDKEAPDVEERVDKKQREQLNTKRTRRRKTNESNESSVVD